LCGCVVVIRVDDARAEVIVPVVRLRSRPRGRGRFRRLHDPGEGIIVVGGCRSIRRFRRIGNRRFWLRRWRTKTEILEPQALNFKGFVRIGRRIQIQAQQVLSK
jgi:hypothetical protein